MAVWGRLRSISRSNTGEKRKFTPDLSVSKVVVAVWPAASPVTKCVFAMRSSALRIRKLKVDCVPPENQCRNHSSSRLGLLIKVICNQDAPNVNWSVLHRYVAHVAQDLRNSSLVSDACLQLYYYSFAR